MALLRRGTLGALLLSLGSALIACSSSDGPASSADTGAANAADTLGAPSDATSGADATDATDATPKACTIDATDAPTCTNDYPAQPCTVKCSTCVNRHAGLWGPCICDGTKWVCETDTDCGLTAPSLPECPSGG